jgi:replication factor A1
MVEAVIGNEEGVFRLVSWAPAVLLGVEAGENVVIRGATARESEQGLEYSLGEAASLSPSCREITLRMESIADVKEGGSYSLAGTVVSVQPSGRLRRGAAGSRRSGNLVLAMRPGRFGRRLGGAGRTSTLFPANGSRSTIRPPARPAGRHRGARLMGERPHCPRRGGERGGGQGTVIPRPGDRSRYRRRKLPPRPPLPVGFKVRGRGTVHGA